MNETRKDCHLCGNSGCIKRIPSLTLKPASKNENKKTGDIVKEYIKATKKELEDTKTELKIREKK